MDRWSILGQSFGGFCVVAYLSAHPGSLREAFITGGLPPLDAGIDEVYGEVFGLTVRSRNIGSQMGAGFKSMFGGELKGMTKALVDAARSLDYGSVNLDMIYGLPGQKRAGFEKSVEDIISLRPDRVAMYSYAHVPWLKPHQRLMPAVHTIEIADGDGPPLTIMRQRLDC